jgi:hypothetical protein
MAPSFRLWRLPSSDGVPQGEAGEALNHEDGGTTFHS